MSSQGEAARVGGGADGDDAPVICGVGRKAAFRAVAMSLEDEATGLCGGTDADEAAGIRTGALSCKIYLSDVVDKIDHKSAGAAGQTRRT
jgi:hypothetical protein